jgi:hypothetical protein
VAGSLSVATTAVSSAKVAVKESGEVLEGQLYKVGIVKVRGHFLEEPRVDWGKACEFSVDFNNEVAIRQIGVKDEEVVEWE